MPDATAAFLRRDWLVWASYRMNVIWQIVGVFVVVVGVVMIGNTLGTKHTGLDGSTSYSAYVLGGLAFTDVFFAGMTSPPHALRDAQVSGTLEPILLTPIRTWQLITAASALQLLLALVRTVLFVAASVIFLGYWHHVNIAGCIAVFVPAFLTFFGLGLMSAAFVMVVKQGDPVVVGYIALSGILGGTIIPVAYLPQWLRVVSALLPLTHALTGMRHALNGEGMTKVLPSALALAAMAAVLVPVGLRAIYWATRRARKEGSLVQY